MANSRSGESVINRVVRLLASFDLDEPALTPAELARRAELPTSTAHRLITELEGEGLLERDADGNVRIGMRLWELTTRGSRALELRQLALPQMQRVQRVVREHTQLAVREGEEALFIERLSHPDAGANITRVAGRLPLHASSAGLVLLAHAPADVRARVLGGALVARSPDTITDPGRLREKLAEVRRSNVAIAPGFIETVSTGIAVPVADATGQVIAALAVVVPRAAGERGEYVAVLQAAARAITTAIAARPGIDR